ncbi:hypothetical protein NDU88_001199, partial [Pleurodeles waltl]
DNSSPAHSFACCAMTSRAVSWRMFTAEGSRVCSERSIGGYGVRRAAGKQSLLRRA